MDMMDFDYQEADPAQEDQGGPLNGARERRQGLFQKPLVVMIVGIVIGLAMGLVYAYLIDPVQWVDLSPNYLREDLQDDWMRMAIDSYNLRQDWGTALQRIGEMGEAGPQALERVAADPGDVLSEATIELFRQGMIQKDGDPLGISAPTDGEGEEGLNKGSVVLAACGVTMILAIALVVMYFLRSRRRGPVEKTAAMRAQEFSRAAPQTDFEAIGAESPVAQWMTTYLVGDDLFDDSFSIDSPAGEFKGECGVGIADTIGVGEPKRVSAFEIWLFDKNDIQTVTKVVMSSHAYNDETNHNRLAAKGEPILAQPGAEVVLETQTLQMVVRVVDMAYGGGALPENSFFERVTLELAVWNK